MVAVRGLRDMNVDLGFVVSQQVCRDRVGHNSICKSNFHDVGTAQANVK